MADGSIMQFDDIKIIGVVGAGQMGRGIARSARRPAITCCSWTSLSRC